MEKVRTNQGGIAICVRLRTGGEGELDFPHFSAYILCGWPLVRVHAKGMSPIMSKLLTPFTPCHT